MELIKDSCTQPSQLIGTLQYSSHSPLPKQSQESCYGMHRVWAPLWAQRTQGGLILQQLWGASQSKLGYSTITLLLGAFGHFQPRCSL